ncbi:MAG: hypothetical protein WC496_02755 [Phycisphaerae bacterium]|jgi:hypothetical protein
MIAYNFNSLCKQAEQYFYDFLLDKSQDPIPQHIVEHLNKCQYCSRQINRLKEVLLLIEEGASPELKQDNLASVEWFKLHFDYLGKPVTCEIVKPFLPGFLEFSLEIKIPTPITVHLDKCKQCQEDLKTIIELNLNGKQLYRLSQLFAAKLDEGNINCSQAQTAIKATTSMNFSGTSKEALEHVCACPDCRKIIYQHRQAVRDKYLNLRNKKEPKMFLCNEISASDYFDYVIPYGLDPADDQYANFRSFFTSHSSICPICLNKMQQLHNTIFGIAERAESDIVTIYHIEEPTKTKAISNPEDIYAGFPIKVEIVGHENEIIAEQSDAMTNIATKQKVSVKKLKPFVKIGFTAAAVILIATALFLNISTAKAATLKGIYKAIEKIKNVHILSFIPDKKEPVREQWVSRTLNVNLIKTDSESVLWDISDKIKKIKSLNSNSVETIELTTEMINGTQNTINDSLGLMPFHSISDIPNDAQWNRVNDIILKISDKIEVYDLIWIEKAYEGYFVSKKWRFFIDSETSLPQKIEFYQKSDTDNEYNLRYTRAVEYLNESEMQKVIKESFLDN